MIFLARNAPTDPWPQLTTALDHLRPEEDTLLCRGWTQGNHRAQR